MEADAHGAFSGSIPVPPKMRGQTIQVTALLPGRGIVSQQIVLESGGLENISFHLTPGVSLTGRLIRPDGKPAANVPVSIAAMSLPASSPSVRGGLKRRNRR